MKKAMIINACECEPFITCDYRMMLERTEQIIVGIKLAKKASGCPEVFIGIEDNKPAAIKAFQEVLNVHPDETIKIVPLETKYPSAMKESGLLSSQNPSKWPWKSPMVSKR